MLRGEIDQAVQEALASCVRSQGHRTYLSDASSAMCAELCKQFSKDACLPASSGTAAVEIALRAIGLSDGDEVLLSGYDYPGNFWAIERAGGFPVLVDTEANSWNLSVDSIEMALSHPHRCRAMVVSHLHGAIQDMPTLRALCDRHDIVLIEDCCQLWGGSLGEQADVVIVSFGGGKFVSAGRGGALLTSNTSLAQKAKIASGAGSGPYAMSEMQCAVVGAQLPFVERLSQAVNEYFAAVVSELEGLRSGTDGGSTELRRPTGTQSGVGVNLEGGIASGTELHGFYQIGWLRDAASDDHALPAIDGIGTGFPGFHRRSSRRCRTPIPLINAPEVAQRTMVLHHRIALEGSLTPAETAKALIG